MEIDEYRSARKDVLDEDFSFEEASVSAES
jgi:hypothetical protein